MAILKIPGVSCSLNFGLIYNVSYSYIPQEGVKVSIYYTNENGVYGINHGNLSYTNKSSISIGAAHFNLYPIRYEIMLSVDRKVLRVDFIDDTFKLNNYFVTLVGKGCGRNVYPLGRPVDGRTLQQKLLDASNPFTAEIKDLVSFDDIEYNFSDFIAVLRQQFSVQISTVIKNDITKTFTGTFKEVLDEWCSYLNLIYFFENSTLKIINPANMIIGFPSAPTMALSYNVSESLENTYSTTAFAYFVQQGGSSPYNGNIKYVDLYPAGYDLSGQQGGEESVTTFIRAQNVDLNQVAAAMYGREYWFLYNYYKGSLQAECGWTAIFQNQLPSQSILAQLLGQDKGIGPNVQLGIIDEQVFDQRFEFYQKYGQNMAGRFYISLERTDPDDNQYQWFDNTTQNTNFDIGKRIDVQILSQGNSAQPQVIPGTKINDYYQGIQLTGNRIVYKDERAIDFPTIFVLDAGFKQSINKFYNDIFVGMLGSSAIDWTTIAPEAQLGPNKSYVIYNMPTLPQDITSSFENLINLTTIFQPIYNPFSIKGYSASKIQTSFSQSGGIQSVTVGNQNFPGKTTITDKGQITPVINADKSAYYAKYSACSSAASQGGFLHKFVQKEISVDVPITMHLVADINRYTVTRDLTLVEAYANIDTLSYLAVKFLIPLKTVSFSLNYLYNVPTSFLSNGLVNVDINISENGISANYTYSNSMLRPPISQAFVDQLERAIRNSYIRRVSLQGF